MSRRPGWTYGDCSVLPCRHDAIDGCQTAGGIDRGRCVPC